MRNEIEREREKSSAERHSLASQLEQATRESKDFSALLRERDEVMLFTLTQTGQQITLKRSIWAVCGIFLRSSWSVATLTCLRLLDNILFYCTRISNKSFLFQFVSKYRPKPTVSPLTKQVNSRSKKTALTCVVTNFQSFFVNSKTYDFCTLLKVKSRARKWN